ncbi:MAG: pre-peptidase C-terminal domain-containing protein, partial [Rhodococcus sp.]|nr:pre-peptidase C-terminal domain-containing protein [Rhodococcus sp. (in: high G+C Gram-positive bacteria)]
MTIAEDDAGDDTPVLLTTPGLPGVFAVEVSMVRCASDDCGWSMQAYSADAPGNPLESRDFPQRYDGALRSTDSRSPTGEFFDLYEFEVSAGQVIIADLQSPDFDTYLSLESPSREIWTNDDYERDVNRSQLEIAATETGRWTVRATSFEPGRTGQYTLILDAREPDATELLGRTVAGSLTGTDERLKDGRYADTHVFDGTVGDGVIIDLRASGFDPVLILFPPEGELHENDDYQGALDHSRIEIDLNSTGQYRVLVTSYAANETGSYELTVTSSVVNRLPGVRRERGRLEPGDSESRGRYRDEYSVDWIQGERYRIDLRGDFDTYLEITGPDLREQNDDTDSVSHSALEVAAPQTGTYQVTVSSYEERESGSYELEIAPVDAPPPTDVEELRIGPPVSGRLSEEDPLTETGRYYDSWVINGEAGQALTLEAESDDFDTVLLLISSDGDVLDRNDDAAPDENDGAAYSTNSRVSIRLPTTGRYRVRVTSYTAGETGVYRVALR